MSRGAIGDEEIQRRYARIARLPPRLQFVAKRLSAIQIQPEFLDVTFGEDVKYKVRTTVLVRPLARPIPQVNVITMAKGRTLQLGPNDPGEQVGQERTDSNGQVSFLESRRYSDDYQYTSFVGSILEQNPAQSNPILMRLRRVNFIAFWVGGPLIKFTVDGKSFSMPQTIFLPAWYGKSSYQVQVPNIVPGAENSALLFTQHGIIYFQDGQRDINASDGKFTIDASSLPLGESMWEEDVTAWIHYVRPTASLEGPSEVTAGKNFVLKARLTDEAGNPIANEPIDLINVTTKSKIGSGTSDSNGVVSGPVTLPAGGWDLQAGWRNLNFSNILHVVAKEEVTSTPTQPITSPTQPAPTATGAFTITAITPSILHLRGLVKVSYHMEFPSLDLELRGPVFVSGGYIVDQPIFHISQAAVDEDGVYHPGLEPGDNSFEFVLNQLSISQRYMGPAWDQGSSTEWWTNVTKGSGDKLPVQKVYVTIPKPVLELQNAGPTGQTAGNTAYYRLTGRLTQAGLPLAGITVGIATKQQGTNQLSGLGSFVTDSDGRFGITVNFAQGEVWEFIAWWGVMNADGSQPRPNDIKSAWVAILFGGEMAMAV